MDRTATGFEEPLELSGPDTAAASRPADVEAGLERLKNLGPTVIARPLRHDDLGDDPEKGVKRVRRSGDGDQRRADLAAKLLRELIRSLRHPEHSSASPFGDLLMVDRDLGPPNPQVGLD
jgi:hypothetical protein